MQTSVAATKTITTTNNDLEKIQLLNSIRKTPSALPPIFLQAVQENNHARLHFLTDYLATLPLTDVRTL